MAKTIDGTGADASWPVRENCVWRSDIRAEFDCEPVDLSSATISAVVTAYEGDTTPLKTFNVTIGSPTTGDFSIQIDEADADLAVGRYWWSLQWDLGNGNEPLASGPFVVKPWSQP